MLINAQDAQQLRIAVVTDGVLDRYEMSAAESGLYRGNIYRGVVASVQPSLDAAFVDIGVERHGMLRAEDVVPEALAKKPDWEGRRHKIDRILKKGQTALVQVVRDSVGNKGALLTTNLSIAGRYLVLMPFDEVRGISRKAEEEEVRVKLKQRLKDLALPEGCGVIARTNAIDQPKVSLNRDLNALLRLWKKVRQEAKSGRGPRLLYSDQDLLIQALRDYLDNSIQEVLIDDDEAYAKAKGYMASFMPRARTRLTLYQNRMPLFSHLKLEEQIESIYQRRVELPSGASIIIEGTEALTAIDVNSGKATRGTSQEETAYASNMEAAQEVARQLRLRDIGGLVVVDFIDMRSIKHQRNVEKALRTAMKDDKARHTVGRISQNGLLEINRQRLKKALQLRTHRECPTCGGAGTIASSELVSLNLLRRIETRAVGGQFKAVRISLHPELADAMQNERRHELAELEQEFGFKIEIIAKTGLHRMEEQVQWITAKDEPPLGRKGAGEPAVSAADLAAGVQHRHREPQSHSRQAGSSGPEEQPAPADKATRKRRRGPRRRRRPAASGEPQEHAKESSDPAASPRSPSTDHHRETHDTPNKQPQAVTTTAPLLEPVQVEPEGKPKKRAWWRPRR